QDLRGPNAGFTQAVYTEEDPLVVRLRGRQRGTIRGLASSRRPSLLKEPIMRHRTHCGKAVLTAAALLAGTLLFTFRAQAQITPPPGNAPFLNLFGDGVQIYDSMPDPNSTGAFVWTFIAPQADLFTSSAETTHFGTLF